MKFLFYGSVFFTGFITIGSLILTQHYTITFYPEGNYTHWSNGNPGLFFILWPLLFIMYFLFAMIFVFEKLHLKWNLTKKRMMPIYAGIVVGILSVTVYRIINLQQQLESYFNVSIEYINPYSNHLLFNFWTLLALLCICAIMSFYPALTGSKTPTS